MLLGQPHLGFDWEHVDERLLEHVRSPAHGVDRWRAVLATGGDPEEGTVWDAATPFVAPERSCTVLIADELVAQPGALD